MVAIRVKDLARSIAFYREGLSCAVMVHNDHAGVAVLQHSGYAMLLADETTIDLEPYLHASAETIRRGASVFLHGGTPDQLVTLRQTLERRGLQGVQMIERPWGDVSLALPDPDGYTVMFWTTVERSPEETLTLYDAGPTALEDAIAGLDNAELDLRASVDSWSVREIVHHLTHAEIVTLGRLIYALAEPGRQYTGNAYSPDTWSTGLDDPHRDIETAIVLLRAIRLHAAHLMRHLPDAWHRATVNPHGVSISAGIMLTMLASHTLEHVEDIREIRRKHEV